METPEPPASACNPFKFHKRVFRQEGTWEPSNAPLSLEMGSRSFKGHPVRHSVLAGLELGHLTRFPSPSYFYGFLVMQPGLGDRHWPLRTEADAAMEDLVSRVIKCCEGQRVWQRRFKTRDRGRSALPRVRRFAGTCSMMAQKEGGRLTAVVPSVGTHAMVENHTHLPAPNRSIASLQKLNTSEK